MTDEILKKVYFKVKEFFIQKENPLYGSFYNDEIKGFDEFKLHIAGDETLSWLNNTDKESNEEQIKYVAIIIINKINRMYYLSGQYEKNKIKYCPDDGAVIKFDEDLGIWKCTECEWKGDLE